MACERNMLEMDRYRLTISVLQERACHCSHGDTQEIAGSVDPFAEEKGMVEEAICENVLLVDI